MGIVQLRQQLSTTAPSSTAYTAALVTLVHTMITTSMLSSSTSTNDTLAPPVTTTLRPSSSASHRSTTSSRPPSARPISSASHRSTSAKQHTHHLTSTSSTRTNPAGEGQPLVSLSAVSTTHSSTRPLVADLPVVPLPSVPLSSLPPSHRPLFVYYRSRIETFEAERQDVIQRLNTLTQHNQRSSTTATAATHSPAALTAQLASLERERSEQRLQATEERRRRLECEAAMRAVMCERLADKKRLAQLLTLTLPKRAATQQFNERNLPPHSAASHNKENHSGGGKRAAEVDEWKRMWSEEREARVQSDREWRRQVDVLAGERRRREKEWAERERQLVGWEEAARRERDAARADLNDVMGEYMQLRHAAQHNERIALERLTSLAAQHNQILVQLRSHTHPSTSSVNTSAAAQSMLSSTASRSTSTRERPDESERPWNSSRAGGSRVVDDRIIEYYSGDMHDLIARNSQLSHRLTQLTEQRKREQQQQQQLYDTVSAECQRWRHKYERECERRTLQCEGYETDVRRMRERLWAMEELMVQMGREGGRAAGSGGSGAVDVGGVLYEMDVAGVEAEIGAMSRQLTTLTQRLALSEQSAT